MYTHDLIEEVKRIYPENEKIHKLAVSGSIMLGGYLQSGAELSISLGEILNADTLEELKEKARSLREKRSLYWTWIQQYENWKKQDVKDI
jgi:hypothetical protein